MQAFQQSQYATPSPPERIACKSLLSPHDTVGRFNACRVPGETEDRVRVYPAAANHHVLVIRRNKQYIVHVTNSDGEPLSIQDIEAQLQAVIRLAGPPGDEARPVGVLTAWGRTEWAKAREQLVADGNEELLERAEAAALAVCLDDSSPETRGDTARALWHGDGRNRHFDKPVQIVVFKNGKAGLVGEHSMMDGMPVRVCELEPSAHLMVSRLVVYCTKNRAGVMDSLWIFGGRFTSVSIIFVTCLSRTAPIRWAFGKSMPVGVVLKATLTSFPLICARATHP